MDENFEDRKEFIYDRYKKYMSSLQSIRYVLQYLQYQERPKVTNEMRRKSHTGGNAELKMEMENYDKSLKVPTGSHWFFEKESRRTLSRVEWGWGFDFVPTEKECKLLKSKDCFEYLLGLSMINKRFWEADIQLPPTEEELFREGE